MMNGYGEEVKEKCGWAEKKVTMQQESETRDNENDGDESAP